MKLETRIAIGALFAFLVLGAACLFSLRSVRQADATALLVAHTYQVLGKLSDSLASLTDAEAGARGYRITGDASYLDRQERDFIHARRALRELAELTRHDPAAQVGISALKQKADDKIAFLRKTASLRESNANEAVSAEVATNRGREIMGAVRDAATHIEETERSLLEQRRGEAARSASRTEYLVMIAGVVELMLLGLALFTVRAEMRRRRRLEEVLRREAEQLAAANEELEAFSYSVSHDLRAPLRHISGFEDLLARQLGDLADPKAKRYLSVIGEAAREMNQLIDDLLSFARLGKSEIRRSQVDVEAMVRAMITHFQSGLDDREVNWRVRELPKAEADAGMLRQVFANLLDNALKYTRSREQTVIEIGGDRRDEELVFYVRDNGVGFDPRYAAQLFGVFQRLHQAEEFEGTGIGLANVRRIIHKHGGRTWAEAEPEAGATFYFALPRRQPPPAISV